MKRSDKGSIYKKILARLRKGELSISDISEKAGISWETACRNLEILKELNVIDEKDVKNRRVFFIKDPGFIDAESDTLLGLPLTEQQRETAKGLFKKIKDSWYKHSKRPLRKTFLQKIAVKLIKENNIENIPYGWYLFGMMSVLQYDPAQDMHVKKDYLENKYDTQIESIVKTYQKFSTTKELLLLQYQEEQNELYITKLKLHSDFLCPLQEEDLPLIKKRLINFALCLKRSEDNKQIIELTNIFVSIVSQLINKLSIQELEDIRSNIINSFESLWECIATYNLYHSLLEKNFYTKERLFKRYQLKVIPHLEVCETYLTLLNDHIPKETQKEDSLSRFKGILAK